MEQTKTIDTLETYQSTTTQNEKELYNLDHACSRNVVERTFGLLKKKWAISRSCSFFDIEDQVTHVHLIVHMGHPVFLL